MRTKWPKQVKIVKNPCLGININGDDCIDQSPLLYPPSSRDLRLWRTYDSRKLADFKMCRFRKILNIRSPDWQFSPDWLSNLGTTMARKTKNGELPLPRRVWLSIHRVSPIYVEFLSLHDEFRPHYIEVFPQYVVFTNLTARKKT